METWLAEFADNVLRGREYDCKKRTIWGFQTGPLWGGYCEYTHLPEVNVVKIPDKYHMKKLLQHQ